VSTAPLSSLHEDMTTMQALDAAHGAHDDATAAARPATAWRTVRRGLQLSPELRAGVGVTLALAVVATAGRVVVPVAVQQTVDHGLIGGHPDLALIRDAVLWSVLALIVTTLAAYLMNARLFRTCETALAALRTRTFRHVHDLSMLHQQDERRGSLVSRVTGDIDEISQFLSFGGIMIVISAGQVAVATVLMLVYSWQLCVVVLAIFVPFALALGKFQIRLDRAYLRVREQIGDMLATIAETVVGAGVIKAYGAQQRAQETVEDKVSRAQSSAVRAMALTALSFSLSEVVAALALTGVVVGGVLLGVNGQITPGALIAFLFAVSLFVGPVQVFAETLNEGQTAIAGWRRVLGVLDTPSDVSDPLAGVALPDGPVEVTFEHVSFAYPGAEPVLHDIDLVIAPRTRVAIVGETGSGKSTLAKLLVRLMDPTHGCVRLSGVALTELSFASLRDTVVLVPQDGFLFDETIADNVRRGGCESTDEQVVQAFVSLGLQDWVQGLPQGVATRVGERGELLSVGERQLVAIARAFVADPHLLVLDEATSSVDPATEVRITRALDALTRGRTTVTIAHRMSTAEAADEVLVVDLGRVVQRGTAAELVRQPGRYATLHQAWAAQRAVR
jgi:ATP-binding cassette subfamily B protein